MLDRNPFNNPNAGAQRSYVKWEAKTGVLACVDPNEGGTRNEVQPGTQVIFDNGATCCGHVRFSQYAEFLAPRGQPEPQVPDDVVDARLATKLMVVVQGHGGLRPWVVTGDIALIQMSNFCRLAELRPEAALGQIPIAIFRGKIPRPTANGLFFAPVFELIDFIDRDENFFGPRIVPPPPQRVETMPPAPQIAAPSAVAEMPVAVKSIAETFAPMPQPSPAQALTPPWEVAHQAPVATTAAPQAPPASAVPWIAPAAPWPGPAPAPVAPAAAPASSSPAGSQPLPSTYKPFKRPY
jgi:hypothetical protein